jgi:hypothetical protein
MKAILFLPLVYLLSATLMGQNISQSYMDLERHLNTSGEYRKRAEDRNKVIGSPYLTEDFQSSLVHWDRKWTEGIDLRYDIYHDCFEAKLKSGIIIIDPVKNNIDTLKHNGEVFVRKVLDQGKEMKFSYLALLGQENGYSVYKRYKIVLNAASTSDGYSEAKPAEFKANTPTYFVFREHENWEVKGNKSLSEIFGIEAKKVKSYLKEKDYKLSREQDLVNAVLYFAKASSQL